MAELLGFDGIIENSLDASQISPSDISLEAAAIVSSTAIRLGAMLDDIHAAKGLLNDKVGKNALQLSIEKIVQQQHCGAPTDGGDHCAFDNFEGRAVTSFADSDDDPGDR